VKKIIVLSAFVAWQIVSAADIQAQQRPGGSTAKKTQATSAQSRASTGSTNPAKKRAAPVRPASHSGEIIEGEIVHEGYIEGGIVQDGYVHDGYVQEGFSQGTGCDSCGTAGCESCSVGVYEDLCVQNYGRIYISLPAHGWVHAEGLTWFQSGMSLPPLVSTSPTGTPRAAAGVLGQQGTSVLFGGNDEAMTDATGGFRIRFGTWLGAIPGLGLEGEYVGLSERTDSFFDQSTGAPGSLILARPFFNILSGQNDSELISFPGVVRGNIGVDMTNELRGAAFRFRRQICCSTGCGFSDWACQTVPVSTRLDLTAGYRFWQLGESVGIREELTSLESPGSFDITDRFETRNQFNGPEIGVVWQGRRGWWSLDALARVAFGNVLQTVNIDGSTSITENNVTTDYDSGFLAQRTNIGTFQRDRFTMVPELGLNLGYQVTRRLRATFGYSLIYWGNVVRPGDQIDLDVNTNLLAPEVTPFTGPLRPQFQFQQTDYWVQGLSYGAEFRW
jgi:hypothetical protein